jgi:hypothetical protein
MWTGKASMFYLQCVILSKTYCGKIAEAAENSRFFRLVLFFNALTHNLELLVQHIKPLQSRPESAVGVCAIPAF